MERFSIVMDTKRCIACRACEAHCATKNGLPEGVFLGTLRIEGPFLEQGKVVMRSAFQACQACEEAWCLEACPQKDGETRAMQRDADGTLYIDAGMCIGCGLCAKACPLDMVRLVKRKDISDAVGAKRVAIKCDHCRDLRAGGFLPACVTACTAHALSWRELGGN